MISEATATRFDRQSFEASTTRYIFSIIDRGCSIEPLTAGISSLGSTRSGNISLNVLQQMERTKMKSGLSLRCGKYSARYDFASGDITHIKDCTVSEMSEAEHSG